MRLSRASLLTILPLVLVASPALAAAPAPEGPVDLLSPSWGLMVWTIAIFIVLFLVLAKFAFPPILGAVEARERSLQEAIDAARADREAAAALLAQHRAELDGARAEAQKLIADGRAAGERVRTELLEQTRAQQEEMLQRAQREIGAERDRAILALRREAVDLAIAGASRVIERNLDDATNREIIESFLASVPPAAGRN